jgi:threonine dehydrogenase-like Zn-dependent dehydrogenase
VYRLLIEIVIKFQRIFLQNEKALCMSDVSLTSNYAADMGEVKDGDTVVIWVLGPIALFVVSLAQIRGARRVIGLNMVKEDRN